MTDRLRQGLAARRSAAAGVTIVAVSLVTVVVGLAAALAVGVVTPRVWITRSANDAEIILDLDKAIRMYAVDHEGVKPTTLEELVQPTASSETGYLESTRVPFDSWGHAFQYRPLSSPTGDDYDIVGFGRDGIAGGEDRDRDMTLWTLKYR